MSGPATPFPVLLRFAPPGDERPPVRLLEGEAAPVLARLAADPDLAPVDLIYADPPFQSGVVYRAAWKTGAGVHRRTAFPDGDRLPPDRAMEHLAPILDAALDLLKPGGALFLHLDWRLAPYARLHLDRRLGIEALRNEIVWRRNPNLGAKVHAAQFGRVTDTLLYYVRPGAPACFHPPVLLRPAPPGSYRLDADGRAFRTAPRGDYTDASLARLGAHGRLHRTRSGTTRIRYDLTPGTDSRGRPVWLEPVRLDSLWTDIPDAMHLGAAERTGYPTQKPLALRERIVATATDPGHRVLDPFCGSGTTALAASRAGRSAVGIDRSPAALEVSFSRLAASGVPVCWESSAPVAPSAVPPLDARLRPDRGAVRLAAPDGAPPTLGWGIGLIPDGRLPAAPIPLRPEGDPEAAPRLVAWAGRTAAADPPLELPIPAAIPARQPLVAVHLGLDGSRTVRPVAEG